MMKILELFLGFKIDLKQWLKIIKEYISLIIIIPSIVGGLEQLVRLLIIKPELIRFFSLTQVFPDGLAFLFYTTLITALLYFLMRVYYFFLLILKKIKLKMVGFLFMNLSVLLALMIFQNYILRESALAKKYDNFQSYSQIVIVIFAILIAMVSYFTIYFLLNLPLNRHIDFHYFFNSGNMFGKIGFPVIIFTILIFLPIYNYNYNVSYIFLESQLEERFGKVKELNLDSTKIMFVNDKYVIVELKKKDNCRCGNLSYYDVFMLEDVIRKKTD